MFPVRPELITSTDESTQYIFDGQRAHKEKFTLVTKTSHRVRGTNAVYKFDDGKDMCGMRVKLTWTFNGTGECAPLFITVSGLNDRELPADKDLVVLKVRGLCIGGVGIGGDTQLGYVVFTRKESGAEKKRFVYYQNEVLIPFMNKMRKDYSGYDTSGGMPIPDTLTGVSWCDGDMSQVKAVTSEHQLFTDNKVIANKQNAARSGVEQPADLAKVFKVMKKESSVHTVSDIDPNQHAMKKIVWEAFHGEQLNCLNLKDRTKRSLIDFISCLPEMATKAATRSNIMHGFYECGLIDKDKSRFPVITKILSTC
jgi:hypothetical protein